MANIQVSVNWDSAAFRERVLAAASEAAQRVGMDARQAFDRIAPVSNDPRTSGNYKRSFRADVQAVDTGVAVTFGVHTRYAVFVEFGTYKDPAQHIIARTAGAITPAIAGHVRDSFSGLL